ncbi:hypothetical protein H4R18_001158 [Coemansia javaensis]|uniref:Uncharacterized protein n=1 Tax=Coemansia javaensis TaxID=2761396 RepID=A0A9W8LLZ6_9FUNG|nr:hypothetical protein H4R18_001158 [Coemansia javaensis]
MSTAIVSFDLYWKKPAGSSGSEYQLKAHTYNITLSANATAGVLKTRAADRIKSIFEGCAFSGSNSLGPVRVQVTYPKRTPNSAYIRITGHVRPGLGVQAIEAKKGEALGFLNRL